MGNSTEEDHYGTDSTLNLFPFVCPGILVLASLVIQSFIVAVNLIDWMKGRSITGADKIITSLGISRIFFHMATLLGFFSMLSSLEFQKICSIFTEYTMFSSLFFNILLYILLYIFFYFKISTSHNVFFLRLKTVISRRVVYLIIASVMFSLGYASISFLVTPAKFFGNSTQDYISNNKRKEMMSYFNLLFNIFLSLMFFTASALLIIFLGIHMSRMNKCGNVTSSTDVYRRTLIFTATYILIWVLCFITSIIVDYVLFLDPVWSLFITNFFLALHSVLLIYVTTKLRNQFLRIVHCGTDYFFNRKAPGPGSTEPIEVTRLRLKGEI